MSYNGRFWNVAFMHWSLLKRSNRVNGWKNLLFVYKIGMRKKFCNTLRDRMRQNIQFVEASAEVEELEWKPSYGGFKESVNLMVESA